MATTVLLCTDGSDRSTHALSAGLALLAPDVHPIIVTVVEERDPTLVTGAGLAGGVMSPEEFERIDAQAVAAADARVEAARTALGLPDAEVRVLRGRPGHALVDLATEVGAAAIVMGSRGRGGLTRAVLGSVSDHLVRHAPCTVLVTGDHGLDEG